MKTAFFVCAFATFFPSICCAQTSVSSILSTRSDIAPTLERGRVLLSINDARALPVLREVATRALSDFTAQKTPISQETALRACFWWGKAAQTFGARDEAIEAWTSALATPNFSTHATLSADEREARALLTAVLLNGLPLLAKTQTLQIIARENDQNAWHIAPLAFISPNIEYSKSPATRDFLVTNGTLNLPVARTPSLYRALNAATLPDELKMTCVVVGFARDGEARDGEKWRQKVRVLYAPIDEDERARAEKIAAQWLRVATLFDSFLGRLNTYCNDGVTTIWLTRQSGEWPQASPNDNWNAGAWIDSAPDQMILFRSGEVRSEAEWLREVAHEYAHIAFPPFAGFASPLEPFGNGRLGETLLMLWAAQSPAIFSMPDERDQMRKEGEVHVARHAIPALETWRSLDPTQPLSTKGDADNLNQLIGLALQIERVYGADILRRALDFASQNKEEAWRRNGIEYSMQKNISRKPPVLRASDLLRGFQSTLSWLPNDTPIWLSGALQLRDAKGKIVALTARDLENRAPLVLKKNEAAAGWIYFRANTELTISVDRMALQIDGDWKTKTAANAFSLFNAGKSGWRKLSFRATRDVVIQSARLKNAPKESCAKARDSIYCVRSIDRLRLRHERVIEYSIARLRRLFCVENREAKPERHRGILP